MLLATRSSARMPILRLARPGQPFQRACRPAGLRPAGRASGRHRPGKSGVVLGGWYPGRSQRSSQPPGPCCRLAAWYRALAWSTRCQVGRGNSTASGGTGPPGSGLSDLLQALGDRRLAVSGLVLVDDALAHCLVQLDRGSPLGHRRRFDIARVESCTEVAHGRLQLGLHGLVALPGLLVLLVPLDLGLDVRHACASLKSVWLVKVVPGTSRSSGVAPDTTERACKQPRSNDIRDPADHSNSAWARGQAIGWGGCPRSDLQTAAMGRAVNGRAPAIGRARQAAAGPAQPGGDNP